jgi:tRNA 5-methylaminomethyl-2-thiouridine biosynthesis bifunctional protein
MTKRYDIAVVGAGIAGCTISHTLAQSGAKLILCDRGTEVATGGSGAAGAFVSPKIGKGGPLQELTNEAFSYASEYYKRHFPEHFHQTGILRVPKSEEDAKRFPLYEPFNHPKYEVWDAEKARREGFSCRWGGFFFPTAGDCDAEEICKSMISEVPFLTFDVTSMERDEDIWRLHSCDGDTIEASIVILATGHRNGLTDMEYMGVKGLWGSRGDYYVSDAPRYTIHESFTVSSVRNGIVKIGATHVKSPDPCSICDGRPLAGLEERAMNLVDFPEPPLLKETLCGMRSGSRDYFPLVGRVIDVRTMLKRYPEIKKGATRETIYHRNLYIINGMGGRGFVFSPLMAAWLGETIMDRREMDGRVSPDRLFWRWVRRLKNETSERG